MPRWYRWMTICIWIAPVTIVGCGDSKTKIPQKEIRLHPS